MFNLAQALLTKILRSHCIISYGMYSTTGRQSGAARVLCSDTGSVYTTRNMENTFRRQDSVAEVCASNMQQRRQRIFGQNCRRTLRFPRRQRRN